jgi:hypothetical protein
MDTSDARARLTAALKSWNGLSDDERSAKQVRDEARAVLEQLEDERAAEAAALLETMTTIDRRLAELVAASKPRLVRSKMTPAGKSQYIRAKGKAEYDKLPWA